MYHNFTFQIREATLNASLSIQDFNKLFEEFVVWPVDVSFDQFKSNTLTLILLMLCLQFLKKYLGKYNISQQVSIADVQWKTFFTTFCNR